MQKSLKYVTFALETRQEQNVKLLQAIQSTDKTTVSINS